MSAAPKFVQELFGRVLKVDGTTESARVTIGPDGLLQSVDAVEPSDWRNHDSTLAPAFFDIHVHGAAGYDVMQGTPEALATVGRYLATRGVAHFLPTTVTAPLDRTLWALDALAGAIENAKRSGSENAALPVGIHLEGPFLSCAKRGVHPEGELREPSTKLFDRFWQASRGHIRLLTVAPELPGALELIRYATGMGVRVSLGHSDATSAEARAGIVAGATSATHTFNAMRRLDHRDPGIAGVVLDSEDIYAELICDGVHVAPEFVRLWLRAKGPDRAILVTDGTSATGMPDGEYNLGGLRVAVAGGRCVLAEDLRRGVETLAGSVLTMDRAVENLRRFTACPVEHALLAASVNPARMLGLDEPAELTPGRPANLVQVSPTGRLEQVILRGRTIARV